MAGVDTRRSWQRDASLPSIWPGVVSSILILCSLPVLCPAAEGGFPRKPIKVIVYTKPGGTADFTARRFVEIATKHRDATFVVENKPGAGGIVAMEKVLQMRADGHTLCICTKSNVSKVVAAGRQGYLDAFDWVALLMVDPECVITRRGSSTADWTSLLADAKSQPGRQIWLGPASGGLDHVTAMQLWERAGITARWIPFKSGGAAIAALLGGQGVAYVGNPADAAGNPELNVAAISASERLENLPNTPTFSELGIDDFDDQFMWRGFALKKGCPPAALDWYDELFAEVTADPEWRKSWEKDGIDVVYQSRSEFELIIARDRADFGRYLQQLDMVPPDTGQQADSFWIKYGLMILVVAAVVWAWLTATQNHNRFLVPLGVSIVCLLLLAQTFAFPAAQGVTAATVPRLWISAILAMSVVIGLQRGRGVALPEKSTAPSRSIKHVASVALVLACYVGATLLLGYQLSTALFLVVMMRLLGESRWMTIVGVTAGWLLFAYLAFERALYVPLPNGRLWELFG